MIIIREVERVSGKSLGRDDPGLTTSNFNTGANMRKREPLGPEVVATYMYIQRTLQITSDPDVQHILFWGYNPR